MNWVTKNIFGFIADMMESVLNFYGSIIGNIFEVVADQNLNSSLTENASKFVTLFALAFLALAAGKQILSVYVFGTAGDADEEPLQLVVRVAQAVAVIGSSSWIFNELLKFSKLFTNDLLSSATEDDVSIHLLSLLDQAVETFSMQAIGFIFTLLLILIGLIIFSVVAGIRGAELTLMKILLPIFAVDLITTNRERWNNFITACVVTIMGYSLQLLLFKLCCMVFFTVEYGGTGATSRVKLITVLGLLVFMIRTPKWLEKFIYSSGIGSATTSTLRLAPLYLIRMR